MAGSRGSAGALYYAVAFAGFALLTVASQPVSAQVVDQIERRLPVLPEAGEGGGADAPALEKAAAPEGLLDGSKSFVLAAVSVRGASVFGPDRIAPLYKDYLARRVTLAELAGIAQAITDLYRDKGYFLSRAIVPPQDIEGGYAIIEVIEGYVEDVALSGDPSPAAAAIAAKLSRKAPTKLADLERVLLQISDLRGVRIVRSAMLPDPVDLRRHTLALDLKVDALAGSLQADNRGTREVGPVQAFLQGAANSAVLSGDQLGAGLFFTPLDPKELLFGQAYYTAPIGTSGLYATAYGSASRIRSGGALAMFDVEGSSRQTMARLSYPMIRTRAFSLWGNLSFSMRRLEEQRMDLLAYEDKTRTLAVSVNAAWRKWSGVTTLHVEVVRGLGVLGASDGASGPVSRPNADGAFTRGRFDASRTQNIGRRLQVHFAATGQTSDRALLSSEEFAFGGARYGRAFDYGAITGDSGVAGAIEARLVDMVKLPHIVGHHVFAFYDVGAVWNRDPLFFEREHAHASAFGVGARINLTRKARAVYEAARPVDGLNASFADESWRHFFSVSAAF